MKIAILYIATGKYDVFWPEFYSSCEQFFCNNSEKHYFVLTDSKQIVSNHNIITIYQESLGWPFNTLYRYRMFLRIKEQLNNYDWIIFFNGNCQFKHKICESEILGSIQQYDLLAAQHPGFYSKKHIDFTYEKRKSSLAHVNAPTYYFAGGINGGKTSVFIKVIQELATAYVKKN